MTTLLFFAILGLQASVPIEFANGAKAIVEVRPDYTPNRPSSSATAFLCVPKRGIEKAITQCDVSSRVKWFNRRDGSIVLLVESSRFVEAFTITVSGKVYPHEEPWYSDATIHRLEKDGARVIFSIHAESNEGIAFGAKAPIGKSIAVVAFDWSKRDQKWLPKILRYE